MRATLISFRLDLARIAISSAGGLMPFLLPLIFAMIFGLAGSGGDFAVGGVVGSVFGVGSILPLSAFTYEWQEQHRRMNGIIPANRTHQVIGRYLTLLVFAAIMVGETAVALGLMRLVASGSLDGLLATLLTSVLGSGWSFIVFELVLFPLFYYCADIRKAMMCLGVCFIGIVALAIAVMSLVPMEQLEAFGDMLATVWSDPSLVVSTCALSVAIMAVVSLSASIAFQRRKEF